MSLIDFERIDKGLKLRQLNIMMPPSFKVLIHDVEQRKEFKPVELIRYHRYFSKIVEYLPDRADAYAMLGFTEYHLRRRGQAIFSYKEAVALEPDQFWFHYNLGLLYFQNQEYEQAIDALQRAVKCDRKRSLMYIINSREIYQPILKEIPNPVKQLKARINEGYLAAHILLGLSYRASGEQQRAKESFATAARMNKNRPLRFDVNGFQVRMF